MLRRMWALRGVMFWAAMFICGCVASYAEPTFLGGVFVALCAANLRDAFFDWRGR